MNQLRHLAVYTDNASQKAAFSQALLTGILPRELSHLKGKTGVLFSNARIAEFLEEEARHESSELSQIAGRGVRTLSSGERKKALLRHLLAGKPDFLILDDPFDNLDRQYQQELSGVLEAQSRDTLLIQLISRPEDRLAPIQESAFLNGEHLEGYPGYMPPSIAASEVFKGNIPPEPHPWPELPNPLVRLNQVSLSYGEHPVLKAIEWEIRQGDFWELRGPNGSGKSSLISMITGDNPKAYGQDLWIFGTRKGSGESVWDIKALIGYFTPAMADRFRGYHSVEHMLISGLTDSIGLYIRPTDMQRKLAQQWLELLRMTPLGSTLFRDLTEGQKRLVFCARAMIKHPPLLILDEPTAGLDSASARGVVDLIRKMAAESRTALVVVSHRDEPGLLPKGRLELIPGPDGSMARHISIISR